MDIRELKALLKNSTSVLILDDGEPAYVVLDYQVYRNLIQSKDQEKEIRVKTPSNHDAPNFITGEVQEFPPSRAPLSAQETEALERLNREIQTLKEQIEQDEKLGTLEGNT